MIIAPFIPLLGKVFDSIFPDKEQAAAAKYKLMELQMSGGLKELEEAGRIIAQEASSDHWIVAAWRPITMLVFVAIIANNYILAPYINLFFSVDVTLELPPDLWDLLKIGLGGYITSRGIEKTMTTYKGGSG